MAQIRPVTITYFIPKTLHHRLDVELSRCFEEEDMHYKNRIRCVLRFLSRNIPLSRHRLVGLQCAGTKALDLEVFYESFKNVYQKLIAEEPIVCDHTGTVIPGMRAPDAAILDVSRAPRPIN